jgi:hypothetical protein
MKRFIIRVLPRSGRLHQTRAAPRADRISLVRGGVGVLRPARFPSMVIQQPIGCREATDVEIASRQGHDDVLNLAFRAVSTRARALAAHPHPCRRHRPLPRRPRRHDPRRRPMARHLARQRCPTRQNDTCARGALLCRKKRQVGVPVGESQRQFVDDRTMGNFGVLGLSVDPRAGAHPLLPAAPRPQPQCHVKRTCVHPQRCAH